MPVVSKFGGSSLADAAQCAKAINIIQSNPDRNFIVVSAPGRRHPGDDKVTDLLLEWHRLAAQTSPTLEAGRRVYARFAEITKGLGMHAVLLKDFEEMAAHIDRAESEDFAASRGEYLMARILASALGYQFVDAANCIRIEHDGHYNDYLSHSQICASVGNKETVMPGFYGYREGPQGKSIKTFARNSSDLSGAIVARALGADLYEIWTDVSGMRVVDPRYVPDAIPLRTLTYRELRELCYSGAEVVHPEAMFPVQKAGIATRVLNTNDPCGAHTDIVQDNGSQELEPGTVIGIAARPGFAMLTAYKPMMHPIVGFLRDMLEPFEHYGLSVEHVPTSVDTACFIVDQAALDSVGMGNIIDRMTASCQIEEILVARGLTLISAVGRAMHGAHGALARLTGAVSRAGVSHRAVTQSGSEMNIIVAVDTTDAPQAVNAVYDEFFRQPAGA